jgi:hypothetical protein
MSGLRYLALLKESCRRARDADTLDSAKTQKTIGTS